MKVYYLDNRHWGYLYHFMYWQLCSLSLLPQNVETYLYLPYLNKNMDTKDAEIITSINKGFLPPIKLNGYSELEYSKNVKESFDLYLDILKLLPKNYKILLSHKELPNDYVIESLRLPKECNNNKISKDEIVFLKNLLYIPDNKTAKRKIYITRSNSENRTVNIHKTRQVLNELEVFRELEKIGFEYIRLENYSVLEKINIFSEAEIIISPNSGALSFLLFSNKNTKLIELIPPDHHDHKQFLEICDFLGLQSYRFSKMKNYDSFGNMVVDTNQLINLIFNI